MVSLCLLFVCAVAPTTVHAADDLSDFSNNLATDIGPLLVLFGDSITKQYLSESTSFLDYFIFAMAPLGIITAIVSAIRVCGHPSLRAFIGRSQEGDGAVEAELCTSTSRDVCELFTRSGITRVLGRPNILELVHLPPHGTDRVGLVLFRDYLDKVCGSLTSDWKEVKKSTFLVAGSKASSSQRFAPNPNLSLNVGIIKRPKWVFVAIAVIGFILQAGVLVLAGTGVWILHWNLNKDGPASRDYAPVMFILGTLIMCGGMWGCAAIIGQTTDETVYKRSPSTKSRLIWLQPGPQTIGDQSFDPFIYLEKNDKPLQNWTSSKKNDMTEKLELYTLFTVLCVLIGYVMQFIGLRGMKAWVSLAQLGVTVLMSILRGLLRVQRLSRKDNDLADKPDMVAGYELDWLAFQLAKQEPGFQLFWHITGQYENAGKKKIDGAAQQNGQKASNDVLQIRQRLAYLTGQMTIDSLPSLETQQWKDEFVAVREKVGRLSAAICQIAEIVFRNNRQRDDILLKIRARTPVDEDKITCPEQLVSVVIKPPSESSQSGWRMDSAQLEAILGLWMWSLISDERLIRQIEPSHRKSWANNIQGIRIISAGPDDDNWDFHTNRQGEMDLWIGPNTVRFSEATLRLSGPGDFGPFNPWAAQPLTNQWEVLQAPPKEGELRGIKRIWGWNPIYRSFQSRSSLSTASERRVKSKLKVEQRVQFVSVTQSLLDLCVQELFTTLTMSILSVLTTCKTTISCDTGHPEFSNPTNERTIVKTVGYPRLDNPIVRTFADVFVENSLGSRRDALFCIIPALGKQLPMPPPKGLFSALADAAEIYRQQSAWERAEVLLRWACARYCTPRHEKGLAQDTPTDESLGVKAMRTLGELYRLSLTQRSDDDRKDFSIRGIKWMVKKYRDMSKESKEITEILDCYLGIAQRIEAYPSGADISPDIGQRLLQAVQNRDRIEALYSSCFVATGTFDCKYLKKALPLAARNNWIEVVEAVLKMKVHPDSKDEDGRTAISYCQELGLKELERLLLKYGAVPDKVIYENNFIGSHIGSQIVFGGQVYGRPSLPCQISDNFY